MTKKIYLGLSEVINLCVLAFFALSTYFAFYSINPIRYFPSIMPLIPAIPYISKPRIIAVLAAYALFALLVKSVATRIERNRFTAICILLDTAMFAFFLFISRSAIPGVLAGNFTSNLFAIVSVAASAFAVLLDFMSLPADRWGYRF